MTDPSLITLTTTHEIIEQALIRIPEGFIRQSRVRDLIFKITQIRPRLEYLELPDTVGREGKFFYDKTRLSRDQVRDFCKWYQPRPPHPPIEGNWEEAPIHERIQQRSQQFYQDTDSAVIRILKMVEESPGYITSQELCETVRDTLALQKLVDAGVLYRVNELVFDPLKFGPASCNALYRNHGLLRGRTELTAYLSTQPGQTALKKDLAERFGGKALNEILSMGGFAQFEITAKRHNEKIAWIRLKGSDGTLARKIALETVKIRDEDWEEALSQCGDVLRPEAKDGKSRRIRVLARSYTVDKAARHSMIRKATLEKAIESGVIVAFEDPEGRIRIAAAVVERVMTDSEFRERVSTFENIKARDIALVTGVIYNTVRRRLQRARLHHATLTWGDVRGRWNLPSTLDEFNDILGEKLSEVKSFREAERDRMRMIQEEERQQRELLRARLVAAFPTWRHADRVNQQILLHIGPPNSGKTHDALNALIEAGSGWYLAPLRLLAFEIFDRLNLRGIPCNLLTGEESITIPDAAITAATIEMFNPGQSGECVVIDEAQMLADPDRGWAWTRALMEAQAPEIHVIAPPTAQHLIEKLAKAATMPLAPIPHQRLAPIQVAETHWPLEHLPKQTILVAFSRQMVLHLKTELERMKRNVSVVYGSLPPEVRRKQADRFANGETEICVATDAVGMGLNLPADYVCFYEVEKFDGRETRFLTPAEVHQIGGRAGRYGISQGGEIGATSRQNLRFVQRLYEAEPDILTHARVAPTVEDLELIPGSLHKRLTQWSELQSIPEELRGALKTADMNERIELARLLTDAEVDQLGLAAALKLINAPTRQSSRTYWYDCAKAILAGAEMPLPPSAPARIDNSFDLDMTETAISCADIYLWLSQRSEFSGHATAETEVRASRTKWSIYIDFALLHKLDTAKRCAQCGRPLSPHYRYKLCNTCYAERFRFEDEDDLRID